MTVVRWNPFRELAAMQNVLDRVFYDTWRQAAQSADTEAYTLAVDVYETDTGYMLAANVPGVNPDNINVRLEDRVLFISAEIPQPSVQAEGTRAILVERPTGRFSRRIQLPQDVDFGNAEARYESGVLMLSLPKRPEAQPKVLTVKAGNGSISPSSS